MSVLYVKEVIAKTSRVSEFDGSFSTQFPVKEVSEVRHQILPVRTLIGKNVIIYFGEILVKAFCIHKEDSSVHLVDHVIHYRGFVMGEAISLGQKPNVEIQSQMKDIFVETDGALQLTVVGVIFTELSFFQDKIVSLSEVQRSSEVVLENETQQEKPRDVDDDDTHSSSSETFAEVIEGINQELTITLK